MRTAVNKILVICALVFISTVAHAQLVVQDDFTGASSSYNWKAFNGACLTAGNGQGTIPACENLPYYQGQKQIGGASGTLPDPIGQGALRFTNGYVPGNCWNNSECSFKHGFDQSGGIISNFTFPSNEGLNVTFTAVSYAGDSGGPGQDGADGISFFLMNGSYPAYDTGALGGSLGYDCSDTNDDSKHRADGTVRGYDGIAGAYIGLGIDEYGNFLNPNDNTNSGPGFQPSRIGLRGAGNIAWAWLSANYPNYYPNTLSAKEQAGAVQWTCQTGKLWDYSNKGSWQYDWSDNRTVYVGADTGKSTEDYPYIPGTATLLPNNNPIATESARTRGAAVPITYKLKITTDGLLSLSYSYNGGVYQPVITGQNITDSNGPLPASFRFGFAGSTGGSTNVHEIMCFKAKPTAIANGSAGLNQKQSAEVRTGTQVYFAYYDPSTWAGSLTATNLVYDSATNSVSIAPLANWDASCVLTGVAAGTTCPSTGGGPVSAEAPTARRILTWNGQNGIPFEWNDLTNAQKSAITAGGSDPASRLDYLRGDRSLEMTATGSGTYRIRTSVLGDIVDSSPSWVGPPSSPYARTWADRLYANASAPEDSGQSYTNFESTEATRTNVVYVGANDGLLHAFRAGAYDASGNWNPSAANDGEELLAYMPDAVLESIHNTKNKALDFSSPNYGHAFYVDATPGTGDLYYGGSWHTWLVGGLGYGGQDLYALDITHPSNFSEANASSLVEGEWTPSTITCANTSCGNDMGDIGGTPVIRRFHNGDWGAVFGNGLNSKDGSAGIYVMLVDHTTGNISFYYLGVPSSYSGSNGIVYATPADLDGDHIVDYVYAGDAKGNLWRFNLTSNDPSQWHVSASPLFSTPNQQPITTQVIVASIPSALGLPRVIVSFGTGEQFPFTNTGAASYATGQQAIYGIWDWNMANWNALGSEQMASLSTAQMVTVADLQQQSVTATVTSPAGGVGSAYRVVSNNSVCWRGDATCGSSGQMGWVLNLPSSNEQVVYNPTIEAGALVVNTLIPPAGTPTNCETLSPTGFTMALSIATGGAFTAPIFITPTQRYVTWNDAPVNGVQLNATGTPTEVTTSTPGSQNVPQAYLVMQTVGSKGTLIGFNPSAAVMGKQVTWAELR